MTWRCSRVCPHGICHQHCFFDNLCIIKYPEVSGNRFQPVYIFFVKISLFEFRCKNPINMFHCLYLFSLLNCYIHVDITYLLTKGLYYLSPCQFKLCVTSKHDLHIYWTIKGIDSTVMPITSLCPSRRINRTLWDFPRTVKWGIIQLFNSTAITLR